MAARRVSDASYRCARKDWGHAGTVPEVMKGREQRSDETTEICETFQSQGTAETELRLSHETCVEGGTSLKVELFHGHFENGPAALPASARVCPAIRPSSRKIQRRCENTTGMEFRHALSIAARYLLVRGRSLACGGLLLGRRRVHRFQRFLRSIGGGDDRQMAHINVAQLARETEGARSRLLLRGDPLI